MTRPSNLLKCVSLAAVMMFGCGTASAAGVSGQLTPLLQLQETHTSSLVEKAHCRRYRDSHRSCFVTRRGRRVCRIVRHRCG